MPNARQRSEGVRDLVEIEVARENPSLADQPVYLERESIERGKEDQSERAEEQPARPEVALGGVDARTRASARPQSGRR